MVDENPIFLNFLRLLCYKATQNRGHSFPGLIVSVLLHAMLEIHWTNCSQVGTRAFITGWWVVSFFNYVHSYLGKWSNLTSIFSKWVETTIWGNDPIWQAYVPNGLVQPPFGEMIQFDKHMFQMGWFNHHLGKWSNLTSICSKWVGSTTNYRLCYLLSISITHQKTIQHKLNCMEPGIEIWKNISKRHNFCLPGTLNNHCF